MATNNYSPVLFRKTLDNGFYFQVTPTGGIVLESDSFKATDEPTKKCWVRSKDNKTLLLWNKEHFEAQNLDTSELQQPDCHFKIQMYNQIPGAKKGLPAMLYVTVGDENMVVCCGTEQKIYPEKKKDIPSEIDEETSKDIFYMTKLTSSSHYEFQSSEHPEYYLGFQADANDPSIVQLVLHHKSGDEVIDASEMNIESVQNVTTPTSI